MPQILISSLDVILATDQQDESVEREWRWREGQQKQRSWQREKKGRMREKKRKRGKGKKKREERKKKGRIAGREKKFLGCEIYYGTWCCGRKEQWAWPAGQEQQGPKHREGASENSGWGHCKSKSHVLPLPFSLWFRGFPRIPFSDSFRSGALISDGRPTFLLATGAKGWRPVPERSSWSARGLPRQRVISGPLSLFGSFLFPLCGLRPELAHLSLH